MCGIAGIVGEDASSYRPALKAMLAAMAHRGPDGTGEYCSPSGMCLLGHVRLAIIDPTSASDQPFSIDDGNIQLVYNGECYNFRELKTELETRGERFTTTGDTEVVCKLLARSGASTFEKMNAMYAIALWNEREATLLLARDYYGQKPLYYAKVGKILVFASEVRALLASGLISRQLNTQAVISFLAYGSVQPPQTIVKSALTLPRGTYATCQAKNIEIAPISIRRQDSKSNLPLKESFSSAVSRHLISDVPIGVFLSGGIDSSAIVAAARQAVTGELLTLSVTFPESLSHSEAAYSREVANLWDTDHREIAFSGADLLRILPTALESMDQPTTDGINTFIVSQAARQAGLTVALSGLGGDEIFGGYSSFSFVPKALTMRQLIPSQVDIAFRMLSAVNPYSKTITKISELFAADNNVLGAYLSRRRMFTSEQLRNLLPLTTKTAASGWIPGMTAAQLSTLMEMCKNLPVGDAITQLEFAVYMEPMLLRDSDYMGMANHLEIRVPFLDADFSSQALKIPAVNRLLGQPPKRTFVESLGNWLPPNVYNRPKQGFVLPLKEWMLGDLRPNVRAGLCAFARALNEPDAKVQEIWRRFSCNPDRVGWVRPWMLFALGTYLEQNNLTGELPVDTAARTPI